MQPLNAIDAIAPALTRTNELMFKPFRFGRSWKLAATAYLAWASSFFFPWPLLLFIVPTVLKGQNRSLFGLLAGIAVAATLIYTLIFYCAVRLNLVEFEMVATGQKMIAPMWRRYSRKVWPWLLTKALISTVVIGSLTPLIVLQMREFIRVVQAMPQHGEPADPQAAMHMLATMFSFYGILALVFFVPKFFGTLLDDFAMPFFIMEDLSVLTSIRRGATVLRAEPLQCIGYLAMKLILGLCGYVMQGVAAQICMIPFFIIGFLGVIVSTAIFGKQGTNGQILVGFAAICFGLVAFAFVMYVAMLAFGYLLLLLDSYAIYFLAGRYPLLGNLLEPNPGQPFTPPPVFPSSEERKDDDGSPPMPMNPAVA